MVLTFYIPLTIYIAALLCFVLFIIILLLGRVKPAMVCIALTVILGAIIVDWRFTEFSANEYDIQALANDKNATIVESKFLTSPKLLRYQFYNTECWIYEIPSSEFDQYRRS